MFDQYPDMNRDGKIDIYDVVAFHELLDKDKQYEQKGSSKGSASAPRCFGHKATNSSPFAAYVVLAIIIWGVFKWLFSVLGAIY